MSEILAALLGAMGVLAAGAFGAWGGVRVKRLEYIAAYDVKILEQRLLEYRKLWKLTEQISQRRVSTLDGPAAAALSERLTLWYYNDGGMFLSASARDSFLKARAALDHLAGGGDHQHVVGSFSSLRTSLCRDVASRRSPASVEKQSEEGT